jgi:hypothetical protein
MLMSQMCVHITLFPLGKLVVIGFQATCLFAMLAPSMMKIDVASVSAIAIWVAIVIAFRYWGAGLPHKCWAVVASDGCVLVATSYHSANTRVLAEW